MQGERQRFAVAYLCSILIHAIALLLLAAFIVRALAEGGAPESVLADTQLSVRTETAPPVIVPTPVPVPRELARIVPKATPEPPSPPPVALVQPLPPMPVPTTRPTIAPTVRPTIAPTVAPTVRPTVEPTAAPTARPTVAPTLRPTPEPTVRATPEPTAEPTARPTPQPTTAPAPAPAGTAVAVAATPSAAPAPVPVPTQSPVRVAALPTPTPAPAVTATAAATAAPGISSLNDRLRAALPTKPTAGMERVDLGSGYTANRVLDAYEAALAPPLAILAKTFGLIYTTRTVARADSIEYVYERVHGPLGIELCRAYKITEHPLRPLESAPDVSKPGAVSFPGPPRDVKPEIETVVIPCGSPAMIKVEPGSITTPVPRRRP